MRPWRKAGFTSIELVVVIVAVAILALVILPNYRSDAVETAKVSAFKNRGRGIWVSIVSANAEREGVGLGSVWPKDLGFDASRTSTEYFRMLMSDNPSASTSDHRGPIAVDMAPSLLGGSGVPCADKLADFRGKNNAWYVVCVGTQTPGDKMSSDVAFLIARNVTIGRQVNALSPLKFDKKSPLLIRRCVYVTFGGSCFGLREQLLYTPAGLPVIFEAMGTNTTYDVMYP